MESNDSPKSRLVALLLCLFLGGLGLHRFYVGKIGTGILIIVTIGGFLGIWPLIDLIMIAVGSFKDKEGRRVIKWVTNE
jgi:TM2 domain-containing membrane protein YozV